MKALNEPWLISEFICYLVIYKSKFTLKTVVYEHFVNFDEQTKKQSFTQPYKKVLQNLMNNIKSSCSCKFHKLNGICCYRLGL